MVDVGLSLEAIIIRMLHEGMYASTLDYIRSFGYYSNMCGSSLTDYNTITIINYRGYTWVGFPSTCWYIYHGALISAKCHPDPMFRVRVEFHHRVKQLGVPCYQYTDMDNNNKLIRIKINAY